MKKSLALIFAALVFSSASFADVYVRGYTRSDGTYVAPHYRSSPNSTRNDNWSTKGNINPYTGQYGTREPDYSYRSPSPYSSPNPYSGGQNGYGSQSNRNYRPYY